MSSLTMVLAVQAVAKGDNRQTRLWLGTTATFGCIFIAGQVYEFTVFYRALRMYSDANITMPSET